jgi:hypothetical protein
MIRLYQLAEPRQKGVALPQMADAASRPATESLVGVARRRREITLEQSDRPTRRAERQRCAQSGYARADDQNRLARQSPSPLRRLGTTQRVAACSQSSVEAFDGNPRSPSLLDFMSLTKQQSRPLWDMHCPSSGRS